LSFAFYLLPFVLHSQKEKDKPNLRRNYQKYSRRK
jgi:hypothetical protein